MKKLERSEQINFRVSKEEKELILRRMKQAGIKSPGVYMRKMAIDGMVVHMDTSVLRELATNLRRGGVLLNQLVKRNLKHQQIYQTDIDALVDMFSDLKINITSLMHIIANL